MTDLVRISGANSVGLPVTLADGSRFVVPAMIQITPTGVLVSGGSSGSSASAVGTELDTDGNIVPAYKAHSFTYDTSGNLLTDTVSSDGGTWVRTLGYLNGALASDSGWVKQ